MARVSGGTSRMVWWSAAAVLVGGAGAVAGAFVNPERTAFSYLFAFAYLASIAVGALILLMIGYATNARWMSVIRRVCENIALLVLPLALLFIPVALACGNLYPWVTPPEDLGTELQHKLEHKEPFLNITAFVLRSVAYFLVWGVAAALLHTWSRRRKKLSDAHTDPEASLSRERMFSCGMLPAVAMAMTFAAVDWLMSLTPFWLSSMYGVYYFAGGFMAAVALVTVIVQAARRTGAISTAIITENHFHALGRLLFAFVVFWAYTAYYQGFLIAIADIPGEIEYYLQRDQGSWAYSEWVLTITHFAVPFFLLLPKRVKFNPAYTSSVAAYLLVVHLGDLYYLVMPAVSPYSALPHWIDVACLLVLGGTCALFGALVQRGTPLVAEADPFLDEGMAYASKQ